MVTFRVIIEGGGSTRAEQSSLREGFTSLFDKLLANKPKPAVICAGGRSQAFEDFENFVKEDSNATCLLLVDSEGPVASGSSSWAHVASRLGDGWKKPEGVTNDQLHFMTEAMEAWLVADLDALANYYGRAEFKKGRLNKWSNLENVPKVALTTALEAATKGAKTKGKYQKSHGFELIGKIDPAKVRRVCPRFAERFFKELETRSNSLQTRSNPRRARGDTGG